MKAIIRAGNVTRGLYIFENSDGEYGYFELLDGTDRLTLAFEDATL